MQARSAAEFHSHTWDIGGGGTHVSDSIGNNWAYNLRAGAGVGVWRHEPEERQGGYLVPASPWAIYVTADFVFSQAGISSQQVQQAIGTNPQIPSLLTATSGKAKYYSTTAGPTFRRRVGSVTDLYATAGFGWLRRTVDFSGAATEGSLLQPSSQGVAGISGNSGAFDAGVRWSRRIVLAGCDLRRGAGSSWVRH